METEIVNMNLKVPINVRRKAKILSANTDLTMQDIVGLLIEGTNEEEILKLAEAKRKAKM